MFRQAVAVAMSLALGVPLWAVSNPIGTVAASNGASVAGMAAPDGSTLYSGDMLSVQDKGNASLILAGGSRALMAGSSEARFSRDGSAIAVELVQGKVQFSSSSQSPVEGKVADVTIRPENTSQTSVAFMTMDSAKHTVLYADRGDWIITTAHDGRSLILRPGEHIEGVVGAVQDQNDQNTVEGQQNKKKKRKLGVIWIGTALVGAATGLGMAFGMSECNTASGSTCGKQPVSPVAP